MLHILQDNSLFPYISPDFPLIDHPHSVFGSPESSSLQSNDPSPGPVPPTRLKVTPLSGAPAPRTSPDQTVSTPGQGGGGGGGGGGPLPRLSTAAAVTHGQIAPPTPASTGARHGPPQTSRDPSRPPQTTRDGDGVSPSRPPDSGRQTARDTAAAVTGARSGTKTGVTATHTVPQVTTQRRAVGNQ